MNVPPVVRASTGTGDDALGGQRERGQPLAALLHDEDADLVHLGAAVPGRDEEPRVQAHVGREGVVGQALPRLGVGVGHVGEAEEADLHGRLRRWARPWRSAGRRQERR
jgi:hypothetical protein